VQYFIVISHMSYVGNLQNNQKSETNKNQKVHMV